jgi:hypothetical protein
MEKVFSGDGCRKRLRRNFLHTPGTILAHKGVELEKGAAGRK